MKSKVKCHGVLQEANYKVTNLYDKQNPESIPCESNFSKVVSQSPLCLLSNAAHQYNTTVQSHELSLIIPINSLERTFNL